jgi:formylmethanofuran dehydrogenase subunit E
MRSKGLDARITDKLVKDAVEFHGHLGPFLVLGLKAGILANSLLGKDYFKTTAIVVTNPKPPSSCFVDGIQFVTGCTMGKGNVKLRRGKNTSVLFLKEGKRLKLKLKEGVLDSTRKASQQEAEAIALELLKKQALELFKVEE